MWFTCAFQISKALSVLSLVVSCCSAEKVVYFSSLLLSTNVAESKLCLESLHLYLICSQFGLCVVATTSLLYLCLGEMVEVFKTFVFFCFTNLKIARKTIF